MSIKVSILCYLYTLYFIRSFIKNASYAGEENESIFYNNSEDNTQLRCLHVPSFLRYEAWWS